jgi:lipoate-protein ligase B
MNEYEYKIIKLQLGYILVLTSCGCKVVTVNSLETLANYIKKNKIDPKKINGFEKYFGDEQN